MPVTNVPRYGGFVGDSDIHSVSVYIPDPGADKTIPLYRFPAKGRIRGVYASFREAVSADANNIVSLNLTNGGTAGTATTSVSGTTGGTVGWAANTSTEISITSATLGEFSSGQWVNLIYDEGGTVAPNFTVHLDVDLYPTP